MSIITELGSYSSKIEAWLTEFLGQAPKWEHIVATGLTFIGPLLATTVTISAGSADGAKVATDLTAAQKDLADVSALLNSVGPTPSIIAALNAVVANLTALLADAHISNPTVSANIQLVIGELIALINAVPTFTTPPTT
jgi:hypothetical protein